MYRDELTAARSRVASLESELAARDERDDADAALHALEVERARVVDEDQRAVRRAKRGLPALYAALVAACAALAWADDMGWGRFLGMVALWTVVLLPTGVYFWRWFRREPEDLPRARELALRIAEVRAARATRTRVADASEDAVESEAERAAARRA